MKTSATDKQGKKHMKGADGDGLTSAKEEMVVRIGGAGGLHQLGEPAVLSEDEFGAALVARIRAADPSLNARYDASTFTVTVEGRGVLRLRNQYDGYRAHLGDPGSHTLRDIVEALVQGVEALPADFPGARAKLYPVLKHRLAFEPLPGKDPSSHQIPYSTVTGGLVSAVAYDTPYSVEFLEDGVLAKWGVSFNEAYGAAVENLRAIYSCRPFGMFGSGCFVSEWYDGYDSSRLLLEDVMRGLEVRGDPVAMAPLRDMLIVTGSEDLDGLMRMIELTNAAKNGGYRVSLVPVRLTHCGWQEFRPPDGHPLHRGFQDLYVEEMAAAYGEQQRRLQAAVTDGTVVPSYMVLRRDGGELCSMCVWLEEAANLLPKTDLIWFQGGDGKDEMPERSCLPVSWGQVAEITGASMEDAGLYPPRFRVDARLTGKQIKALQAIGGIPKPAVDVTGH